MDDTVSPKTIVMADNEQFIVHAYKSGLEEAGYVVVTAEDGEAAVQQILAVRPDLVLLELMLPKIDGFTVLKTIKADSTVAGVPVLVLTNLSQASDAQEALTCGAVEVLVKTEVSLQDVLLHIQRLLDPIGA